MLPFLILKNFGWLIHDDMEFVLFLEGPFKIEISSNVFWGTETHEGWCRERMGASIRF